MSKKKKEEKKEYIFESACAYIFFFFNFRRMKKRLLPVVTYFVLEGEHKNGRMKEVLRRKGDFNYIPFYTLMF